MSRLRIAIDLLFEQPVGGSSAVDYLRNLVLHLGRLFPEDRFLLLGNVGWWQTLRDSAALPSLEWVDAGPSNEHRLRRIATQQLWLPVLLRRLRANVLYAAGNVMPLVGCPCPAVVKLSSMHHVHAPELIGWTRVIYRRVMFRAAARRATFVLANSESTAADVVKYLGVPRSQVRVVYEAVDPAFNDGAVALSRQVPDRYVLFVSSLWPYKEPELAYAGWLAATRALENPPDLVFVGDDPDGLGERIRRRAAVDGVEQRIHFLGRVPNLEMPAVYRRAVALVYPSRSETFGKPLVEAMLSGIPVIATDTGAIPEVVGNAGRLVPVGDEPALAAALRTVLASAAVRETMIRRGLERGAAFTWESVARSTHAVLAEAAATRVQPRARL
jgi:glycosyltransferase involved in cell wall biosynthesis